MRHNNSFDFSFFVQLINEFALIVKFYSKLVPLRPDLKSMEELKIIEIINSPNAILHDFGIQVYERTKLFLQENQTVLLSFEGLKNVTSGFCNASIGKLYLDFPKAEGLLQIQGLEKHSIWQEKVSSAIDLAKNPKKITIQNNAISELLTS